MCDPVETALKVRENRARRALDRMGQRLEALVGIRGDDAGLGSEPDGRL